MDTTLSDLGDVRAALQAAMSANRADLDRLVRIPSVSAPGFDPAEVRRSATAVCELLGSRGLEHARLLEVPDAHPAVYADWAHAGDEAPTVLLYAHHDVQPAGDPGLWSSPPFAPTERGGRLYGRGTADDKAGILVHVAAVDAWLRARSLLPVNVKLIVEGEEETGSAHLTDFLTTHGELLRADVVVIADLTHWRVGVPTITYLLRGLVDCEVEVRGLDHALHSGMYGGPVPDPLTGLVKLLAAMTDEHGAVAIPGLRQGVREPGERERARLAALDFDVERFRAEAGLLDGVELGGDPRLHVLERLWMRPNVTVIGLDAPPVAGSSNTLVPAARARVSVRLAPGQDALRARAQLCEWLTDNAPWGLHTSVIPGAAAGAFVAEPDGPAFQAAEEALAAAYDRPVVYAGSGGTIPFIEPLGQAFAAGPGRPMPALLTSVGDPDTRAHGVDESLHLDDWHRACLAGAYLLDRLAGRLRPQPAAGGGGGSGAGRGGQR